MDVPLAFRRGRASRRSRGGTRRIMGGSRLLQIITAVDEDAVKRLLEVYRGSMDGLAGGFESPAAMEREDKCVLYALRPGARREGAAPCT